MAPKSPKLSPSLAGQGRLWELAGSRREASMLSTFAIGAALTRVPTMSHQVSGRLRAFQAHQGGRRETSGG